MGKPVSLTEGTFDELKKIKEKRDHSTFDSVVKSLLRDRKELTRIYSEEVKPPSPQTA